MVFSQSKIFFLPEKTPLTFEAAIMAASSSLKLVFFLMSLMKLTWGWMMLMMMMMMFFSLSLMKLTWG